MIKFRIRSVDEYGYNGREHHPHRSDVGLVVVPVAMSSMFFHPEGYDEILQQRSDNGEFLNLQAVPYVLGQLEDESGERGIETVYKCVTPDGRLLDLMDFELEAFNE